MKPLTRAESETLSLVCAVFIFFLCGGDVSLAYAEEGTECSGDVGLEHGGLGALSGHGLRTHVSCDGTHHGLVVRYFSEFGPKLAKGVGEQAETLAVFIVELIVFAGTEKGPSDGGARL